MKFTIRCHRCGDLNPIEGQGCMGSVTVLFEKCGAACNGLIGLDKMIIFCENCGSREEHAISWPLSMRPVRPCTASDTTLTTEEAGEE